MEKKEQARRQDRLKPYLENVLKAYVFDELSESFLERLSAEDLLRGVPMPIRATDLAALAGGGSLAALDLVRAVAVVLGADPQFAYAEAYKAFLRRVFGEKTEEVLVNEGHEFFQKGDRLRAACLFRAAVAMNGESLAGLYYYALCCREQYLASEDETETGRFKAESIEALEKLALLHPDFAFTHYYLGYAYLNMGLYTKAYLAWRDFLDKVKRDPKHDELADEIREIEERIESLSAPMEVERGVAAVSAGRYHEGIAILTQYTEGAIAAWWPLHYYLGIAYESTGSAGEAIAAFRKALELSPSNIDVMDELVGIYHALGDRENEIKYASKIEVVRKNYRAEHADCAKHAER